MTGEKSRFKLIVYSGLFLALFYGFLQIFIETKGLFIRLEFLGFLFLLLLVFIGYLSYEKSLGEHFFFFVFTFYLGNLILLWYFTGSLYLMLLFLSSFGFLLSLPSKNQPSSFKSFEEQHEIDDELTEDLNEELKLQPELKKIKTEIKSEFKLVDLPPEPVFEEKKVKIDKFKTDKVKTEYSPGKFVASSRSNIYHQPKCDWAKKIKAKKIWFSDKNDAEKKQYRPHNCIGK